LQATNLPSEFSHTIGSTQAGSCLLDKARLFVNGQICNSEHSLTSCNIGVNVRELLIELVLKLLFLSTNIAYLFQKTD